MNLLCIDIPPPPRNALGAKGANHFRPTSRSAGARHVVHPLAVDPNCDATSTRLVVGVARGDDLGGEWFARSRW
jgi:hypothetical protein